MNTDFFKNEEIPGTDENEKAWDDLKKQGIPEEIINLLKAKFGKDHGVKVQKDFNDSLNMIDPNINDTEEDSDSSDDISGSDAISNFMNNLNRALVDLSNTVSKENIQTNLNIIPDTSEPTKKLITEDQVLKSYSLLKELFEINLDIVPCNFQDDINNIFINTYSLVADNIDFKNIPPEAIINPLNCSNDFGKITLISQNKKYALYEITPISESYPIVFAVYISAKDNLPKVFFPDYGNSYNTKTKELIAKDVNTSKNPAVENTLNYTLSIYGPLGNIINNFKKKEYDIEMVDAGMNAIIIPTDRGKPAIFSALDFGKIILLPEIIDGKTIQLGSISRKKNSNKKIDDFISYYDLNKDKYMFNLYFIFDKEYSIEELKQFTDLLVRTNFANNKALSFYELKVKNNDNLYLKISNLEKLISLLDIYNLNGDH